MKLSFRWTCCIIMWVCDVWSQNWTSGCFVESTPLWYVFRKDATKRNGCSNDVSKLRSRVRDATGRTDNVTKLRHVQEFSVCPGFASSSTFFQRCLFRFFWAFARWFLSKYRFQIQVKNTVDSAQLSSLRYKCESWKRRAHYSMKEVTRGAVNHKVQPGVFYETDS